MEKSEKIAVFAISVNLALFGIKFTFAVLSHSIALKAEAIHSLSDVVASLTVFGGLMLAKRKSKKFPYGLYKVENLVSIIVALAIFFAGYEIVAEALQSGIEHQLENVLITLISVLCVIGITFGFSRYELKVGKEINSPSLIADAQHIRVDMFAGAVVLVGLLSNIVGFNLDRIAAFIIAIFIAWSGGEILLDAIRVLLDASLDYETLSQTEKIILSEPQVVQIKNLTGRNSGRYKFIEADIVLKIPPFPPLSKGGRGDFDKAHFVANRIETKIKEVIKNVDHVFIHYEPTQKENLVYAMPIEDNEGRRISEPKDEVVGELNEHFGEALHFILVTVRARDKTFVSQEIIENPFTHIERGKGILVAEFLIKRGVDVVITREPFEGKGPTYVFSDAAVEVLLTEEYEVKKVLENAGVICQEPRLIL